MHWSFFLENQLLYSSSERTIFPVLNVPYLPVILSRVEDPGLHTVCISMFIVVFVSCTWLPKHEQEQVNNSHPNGNTMLVLIKSPNTLEKKAKEKFPQAPPPVLKLFLILWWTVYIWKSMKYQLLADELFITDYWSTDALSARKSLQGAYGLFLRFQVFCSSASECETHASMSVDYPA